MTSALELSRDHLNDAIDVLEDADDPSTASVVAVFLMVLARIVLNARLTKEDEGA